MSTKHIQFSNHSSLSTSTSPLLSDDGPVSPPSGSLYHYSPSTDLQVTHPALIAERVHLNYDVSLTPTPGVTLSHPTYHISSLWDQPITSPPTPFMEVECASLPWMIKISPSRNSKLPYITFRDFFGHLYYNLRKQVTQAEYNQVKSGQLQRHIDKAYKRRYKRIADRDQYNKELQGGVRRVDFLGEYVQFAGLSPILNGRSRLTLETTALGDLEVMKLVPTHGSPGSLGTTVSPTEKSVSDHSGLPSISLVDRDLKPSQTQPTRTIDFICWPDSGKFVSRSASALKSEGILSQLHQRLPVIFGNGSGGCLIALVSDTDCQTWVEEHFDDDLLVEIRERGIGGPLPSVMGINQPALVLFGDSADSDVLYFAEVLANHSMYPVIVQPPSENVASNKQYFSKDIGDSSEPLHDDSGGERRGGGNGERNQHGEGQGSSNGGKRAWKGDHNLPDDDLGESDDRNGEDGNGKDRNESDVQDIDGFGNPHTTIMTVEFNIGKASSPNLQRLILERHVKIEGANRSLKSLERDCNVQVHLLVTPSGDGAEVKQCGSRTKLSFLAHATNPFVMNKLTYLRGPNDPAPQRSKNATASAKTVEGGFDAGLSGKVTGKWGKTTTRTLEIQDSSDLPESGWLVRYFGAHSDKGEEIKAISLDAKFERVNFSGGRRSLQERLDVIYGMGVNLIGERPKIGFAAQDNIDIWIPMKSKAKHAGVMLMVLDYIADISKDSSPLVLKEMCHSEDVLVDSSLSLQGREVGVALGVNSDMPAKIGKLDGLAKKVANFVGWQDTDAGSPLSASDIRDMFPAALGWDWKNQEVIPSVWASVDDLEANGWKIIREAPPPVALEVRK